MDRPIEYTVIAIYMLLMMSIGYFFSRDNRNSDDYFRGGCKGAWWLVGTSGFMSGFSAWTFTGAAGAAFEAGWSVLVIYIANILGFLIGAWFLGPWFRQLRVAASTEVDELRYSSHYAQFASWIGVVIGPLYSAVQLFGLAVFTSALFGYDVFLLIIVLGGAVVVYSTFGGVWGVMATDFLQGMILVPFTILVAAACLLKLGGFSGMTELITQQGLEPSYRFFKVDGEFPLNAYTWGWAAAMLVNNVMGVFTLGGVTRYATVRDGADARKAALLGALLSAVGMLVWFIPPITARLLYSEQVSTSPVGKPAEAAFAVASLNVLPVGLTGILAVVMFSATMSSMDSGINRRAAMFMRVIYPSICRWRGRELGTDSRQVALSRLVSLGFGVSCILIALYFAQATTAGLLGLMLDLIAFFAGLAIPSVLGLFVKRVPAWAPYPTVVATMVPAALGVFSEALWGEAWSFQMRTFANLGTGTVVYFATIPFYRYAPEEYRRRATAFFVRMKTPIDTTHEVGIDAEEHQCSIIGIYTAIIGSLIAALALLPDNATDALLTLSLGLIIGGIGAMFIIRGRTLRRRRTGLGANHA